MVFVAEVGSSLMGKKIYGEERCRPEPLSHRVSCVVNFVHYKPGSFVVDSVDGVAPTTNKVLVMQITFKNTFSKMRGIYMSRLRMTE